jgi:hypothetical protein
MVVIWINTVPSHGLPQESKGGKVKGTRARRLGMGIRYVGSMGMGDKWVQGPSSKSGTNKGRGRETT